MHHFIYPSKDTFITNRSDYDDKNFGIDEILGVGTKNTATKIWKDIKEYSYSNTYVTNLVVDSFTGTASVASFGGTASFISGSISGSGSILSFQTQYFSGSLVGSIAGIEGGASILSYHFSGTLSSFSGSILTYASASAITTASYTGSWDSASIAWDAWESMWNWNVMTGSVGLINGFISGSTIANCQQFFTYNGTIQNLDGTFFYGFLTGTEYKNQRHLAASTIKYPNRTLMQFNLDSISASIASKEIATPDFRLNLRIAKEVELPIPYSVYAFPINQSWEMGNGYYYDGGSDTGVTWDHKDYADGTPWYVTNTASLDSVFDFVSHPEQATSSWARGGGTWYTSSAYICSQSFNYTTSDIVMDVNRIVHGWLSGSISNYGIILISSDELASTGSQFDLSFFSRDTNTIYTPYLDAGWSDQGWNTGSITLVDTVSYPASGSANWTFTQGYLLSGSSDITAGAVGFSASLSGNFGLCGPANAPGGVLDDDVTATITSGPANGVVISGRVAGSVSGSVISGSFVSGQLTGCGFIGTTTPYWTGYISGSTFLVNATGSYLINGSTLIGTTDPIIPSTVIGTIAGYLVTGLITGSYTAPNQFLGLMQNGWSVGYYVSGSVTGTYLTCSANSVMTYTSRSLEALQTNQPFVIVVQNIPSTVKANNIIRINVFGREEFPLKNFTRATQLTQFLTPKYLPTSSYYALKDNETEQIVQDFDNYTKISCDENGNYFLLDTSCLPQERYFRILIKVEQSGSIYSMDHGNVFKVVR